MDEAGVPEINETLYRTVLADPTILIIRFLPDFTIIFANTACCRFLNCMEKELVGMNLLDIIPPENRHMVTDHVSYLSPQNPAVTYEHPVILGHDIRWLRRTDRAIFDKEGNIVEIHAVGKCITAHKQAEELYRTLANSQYTGVYVIKKKRFRFLNSYASTHANYSETEMMNIGPMELVHPDDRDRVRSNAVKMLKGELSTPYEYRIISKEGKVRWILETVSPIFYEGEKAILGNFMDITERKEAQEKLERMEDMEASILDASPNAVLGLRNHIILFANRAAENIFGWSPDELIGKNIRILYRTDEEYEEIARKFILALTKKKIHSEEFPYRHKDGRDIICRVRIARIGTKAGRDSKEQDMVAGFEDITEQKKIEEKLIELNRQLRFFESELSNAEERERKRIAMELHDSIGQALAMSKIKLQMLLESVNSGLADPMKEVRELIDKSILGTRSLMLEVRPSILHESGLGAAIAWLTEQVRMQHGMTIHFQDDGKHRHLEEDIQITLYQATRELIMNVIKHSRADRIAVSILNEEDGVRINVEDNGIGFDPSKMDRPGNQGGFGLFSIRERIHTRGGDLSIKSDPGRGTCVSMKIPFSTTPGKQHAKRARAHTGKRQK
ncbi:MAG: PAS domain S-box protein [Syntrophales bacterium]